MSGTVINAVGRNKAEKIIYTAQVMSAEEGANIGLVHKVVPFNIVIPEVQKEMNKWLSVPGNPFKRLSLNLFVSPSF
jgi:enoyl-CoA hydratase/carnithine racemase